MSSWCQPMWSADLLILFLEVDGAIWAAVLAHSSTESHPESARRQPAFPPASYRRRLRWPVPAPQSVARCRLPGHIHWHRRAAQCPAFGRLRQRQCPARDSPGRCPLHPAWQQSHLPARRESTRRCCSSLRRPCPIHGRAVPHPGGSCDGLAQARSFRLDARGADHRLPVALFLRDARSKRCGGA